MSDPFESYKLYNALRLHFQTDYDAIKYNYKSNVTPQIQTKTINEGPHYRKQTYYGQKMFQESPRY